MRGRERPGAGRYCGVSSLGPGAASAQAGSRAPRRGDWRLVCESLCSQLSSPSRKSQVRKALQPDPAHLARASNAVPGAHARRPRGPASGSSPPGRPVPESPARRFPGRRVRARRPRGWRCSGSRAEQVTDPLPPRPAAGGLCPAPAEPPAELSEPSGVARSLSPGPCPARASLPGCGVGNVGGPSGRFLLQSAAW